MKYVLAIILLIAFAGLWIWFTNRFLPRGVLSSNNHDKRYDERQVKIFMEVLARTCVWLVFSFLWNIIMKALNIGNIGYEEDIPSMMNEVGYLAITLIWLVINYFAVKKKYTPSDNDEE